MIKKLLFIFLIFIATSMPAHSQPTNNQPVSVGNARGIIVDIKERQNSELTKIFGEKQIVQLVKVKILSGRMKNRIIETENQITQTPRYDLNLKKGEKVILEVERQNGHYNFYVLDKERAPVILLVAGTLLILLLILGGENAALSILTLFSSIALIFYVLFPLIFYKGNIVQLTLLTGVLSIIIGSFLNCGLTQKSLAASFGGTISIVFVTGTFISLIKLASLTGYTVTTSEIAELNTNFDFKGILTASVIITTLGFIMNTAMAIADFVNNDKIQDKSAGIKYLYLHGMKFGQKIIGQNVNSLILAYLGFMLPVFLIFPVISETKFLNYNSIVAPILAALTGSIGIVLCAPLTAITTSYLSCKEKE